MSKKIKKGEERLTIRGLTEKDKLDLYALSKKSKLSMSEVGILAVRHYVIHELHKGTKGSI